MAAAKDRANAPDGKNRMLTKADLTAATLASVLEQSSDCVKLIGLEGEVIWMNPNGLCAMEIDDFAAVENRPWPDLWPEASRQHVRAALTSAAIGNVARFEDYCPTNKGTMRRWSVSVSRVEDSNREHVGYLATSRDITNIGLCPRCGGPSAP
jgi:PAS domain S-box-containing protein